MKLTIHLEPSDSFSVFASLHDLELVVLERNHPPDPRYRYIAKFANTHVDGHWMSGDGATVAEAVADYLVSISGRLISTEALHSPEPRTVRVPAGLAWGGVR